MSKADTIKQVKAGFKGFLKENGLILKYSDDLELVLTTPDKGLFDEGYVQIPMSDLRTRR